MPYCNKCKGFVDFVYQEQKPKNSNLPVTFVVCESCQSVIGVIDQLPNKALSEKLDALDNRLNDIESMFSVLSGLLNRGYGK